jgi:hypothetical protein
MPLGRNVFDVARNQQLLAFTNSRLGLVSGREEQREGFVSVTVGVKASDSKGRDKLDTMMERKKSRHVC